MKEINRIKKYREFKEILNLRKFKRNEIFAVYSRDNEYKHARVGILVTKKNIEKHKIVMVFFDFKKKCDKEDQLGLKDVKFDLIDLSEGIESYDKHYYLIACDINKEIDFELSYGTFKVLNTI